MLWVKTHTDVSLTHFGEMLSKNKYKHILMQKHFFPPHTFVCQFNYVKTLGQPLFFITLYESFHTLQ